MANVRPIGRIRDQDPCFRAIIFSQFTSFLDLIEVVVQRENLVWYRLDGSTDLKRRHQAISEFKEPSREPKVFLLSLKAGGVGLNVREPRFTQFVSTETLPFFYSSPLRIMCSW